MIKGYLAGPIFTQRDMDWNQKLAAGIRKAYPGIDLYLAQENKSINDKRNFADSQAIFDADFARLKEADILIATISGDMPPIGTSCEVSIFSEMIQQNPDSGKRMVCLYDDTRDMTITEEKASFSLQHIAENQVCYTNLLLIGAAKRSGIIVKNEQQLFEYMQCLYDDDCKQVQTSGIYCFTNRMNGKQYIGQSTDLNRKLKEHWRHRGIDHNSAIDLALEKYGNEYFTVSILEQCTQDQLNEREKYWIEKFNTVAPNGYNLTKGGDHSPVIAQYKEVSCYDLEGEKIATFESIIQAAKYYNLVDSIISACCKQREGYKTVGGYIWRYGHEKNITPPIIPTGKSAKKTIYCYDKNTKKLIQEYSSAEAASEALGKSANGVSNIRAACRGKHYYVYGYIWSDLKWDIAPDNYQQINYNRYYQENI